ncbi:hypothetical protein D7S89_13870 [Trinickia fusca]|uniref:Uncharacterized protein n=1 Tax=Trinickia fusca TaxID=2419777 RepID=A0A494XES7_9BURK|nr:hypothetical protein D7S89_13870 [Trinickia fusca]
MRRVGKRISERIQSAVMRVYKHTLTVSGDFGFFGPAHLVAIPKSLTLLFRMIRQGSLPDAGKGISGDSTAKRRCVFTLPKDLTNEVVAILRRPNLWTRKR